MQRITDPIFAVAARNPARRALATMDEAVTYGDLRALSISFALHMRHNGITHRSRVAIAGDHPIIGTALIIACALVGCSWLRATQLAAANPALGVTHLLHPGHRVSWPGAAAIIVGPHWTSPPRAPAGGHAELTGFRSPHDPWMIAHSSGTTGQPKFMALTDANVGDRLTQGAYAAGRADRVSMSLFPVLAYANVLPCVRSLAEGGSFIFGDLADLFGRVRIDSVMGSPAHFSAFMANARPGPARIPEAIVGGAGAGPEFFRRLMEYFESVEFLYGSTEAAMTAIRTLTRETLDRDAGGVGKVARHCELRIIGADGAPVPAGTEGEVCVRASGMVTGYLNEPELNRDVFRDGWFHPGDLGRVDETGTLHITGRVNDMLNVGGTKLNPAIGEAALQSVPGVRDIAFFAEAAADGVPILAAAVVPDSPVLPADLATRLGQAARGRMSAARPLRRIYLTDRLPRNENGKVMRHRIADAVRGLPPVDVPLPG